MTPLERKRLELDLTQAQLAEQIGVTAGAISSWETGTRQPQAGMYFKLAKALGITTEQLVELVSQTINAAKAESASK